MTIFEAYNTTKQKLEKAGIEDFVFEAKQIIKHITGLSATQILMKYNTPLTDFQKNNLTAILRQREIRYPLQYIIGEWDFYARSYVVGPGVLIPRQDTEAVVEKAIEFLGEKKNCNVLDLCAGSGCIGISIACEKKDCKVDLVEKYTEALNYTKKNITKNSAINAIAYKGDIFKGDFNDRNYDLIVSNPPYIPENEMRETSPEVAFEPETALLAQDGGLEFYKAIINNYTECLNKNGMMIFEVGKGESKQVAGLLTDAGYIDIQIKKDYNEIERGVSGIKK